MYTGNKQCGHILFPLYVYIQEWKNVAYAVFILIKYCKNFFFTHYFESEVGEGGLLKYSISLKLVSPGSL